MVKGSLKTEFKRWSQSFERKKGFRESKADRQKRLKENPPTLQVWLLFVRSSVTGEKIAANSLMTVDLKPDGTCTFWQYTKSPNLAGEYEARLAIAEYNFYAYESMMKAPRHVIAIGKATVDMPDEAIPKAK